MNEWTVVTVIIALVGLVAAVVKPVISLNSSITRLTAAVSSLETDIEGFAAKNNDAHVRLWKKNTTQDEKLHNHETRLQIMETAGDKPAACLAKRG